MATNAGKAGKSLSRGKSGGDLGGGGQPPEVTAFKKIVTSYTMLSGHKNWKKQKEAL